MELERSNGKGLVVAGRLDGTAHPHPDTEIDQNEQGDHPMKGDRHQVVTP